MRFAASWVTFSMLLSVIVPLAAQGTKCPCNNPPGEEIVCEPNQAAFCDVRKGRVYGMCVTPPPTTKGPGELQAWALSRVLGEQVPVVNLKTERYQAILKSGMWKTADRVVTFRLPAGTAP